MEKQLQVRETQRDLHTNHGKNPDRQKQSLMSRKRKILDMCKATPIRLIVDFSLEIVGTNLVVHLSHQGRPEYTGMGSLSLL